jgi:hypothetical protein
MLVMRRKQGGESSTEHRGEKGRLVVGEDEEHRTQRCKTGTFSSSLMLTFDPTNPAAAWMHGRGSRKKVSKRNPSNNRTDLPSFRNRSGKSNRDFDRGGRRDEIER